tara:strand:- start:2362 stop:2781 length:420 start_codon:yes stop_codon:yes gene_type:complete
MTLLEECIASLGDDIKIYDKKESNELFDLFQRKFKFTKYGKIDWTSIYHTEVVNESIIQEFFDSKYCYIMWDELSLPVIKAPLLNTLSEIDEVTAVSFDTWILSTNQNSVIEYYHEGTITLGTNKYPGIFHKDSVQTTS